MFKYQLTPSIMTCDLLNLDTELKKLKKAGINWLHLDFMDGKYVNNFGLSTINLQQIKQKYDFTVDVHCMVNDLENVLNELKVADYLTIHLKSNQKSDLKTLFQKIKKMGIKVGLALDLDDKFNEYQEYLELVDLILIMAIKPGFAGQPFEFQTWQKINLLNNYRKENHLKFLIQIDGGVRWVNIARLIKKDVDLIVVGSMLFEALDYQQVLARIETEVMSAQKIMTNLYLGDQYSAPKDAQIIINCAEELFPQITGENLDFQQIKNIYYFNFEDLPRIGKVKTQLVSQCLKTIDQNLKKNKKVYVHCLWGVNRSASMVFMYLVKNDFLPAQNVEEAIKKFQANYPKFDPNWGYAEFIKKHYPFKNL